MTWQWLALGALALGALLLVVALVLVLVLVVFPAVEPRLPFDHITLEASAASDGLTDI